MIKIDILKIILTPTLWREKILNDSSHPNNLIWLALAQNFFTSQNDYQDFEENTI